MPFTVYPGETSLSGTDYFFLFKERMKVAGWTVAATGGGSDGWVSASSDGFDNTGSAGGDGGTLRANSSWFILKEPDTGLRSLAFQKSPSTTDRSWKVYYSSDGVGFVTGAATATTFPSASDGRQFVGGGGSTNNLIPTATTWIADLIIGDEEEDYSFAIAWRFSNDGPEVVSFLGLDVLKDPLAEDPDPAVVLATNAAGFFSNRGDAYDIRMTGINNGYGIWCWFMKNTNKERWAKTGVFGWIDSAGENYFENLSPDISGAFDTFGLWYGTSYTTTPARSIANNSFYKGRSQLFRFVSKEAGGTIAANNSTDAFPTKAGDGRMILEIIAYPHSGVVVR